jgi:putative ABC transport system permease protein
MKFIRIIKMAFSSMKLNKTRTFLSMLGVIVGVASLILITSFGYGAQAAILERIQAMGSNTIVITAGRSSNMMRGAGGELTTSFESNLRKPLTYDDLRYLKSQISDLNASPLSQSRTTTKVGDNTISISVAGTNEDFLSVQNYKLDQGRSFINSDITGYRNVCILGSDIATQLFESKNPIEQTINLFDSKFIVIGILKSAGTVGFSNVDTNIYIPITRFQVITEQTRLQSIYVKTPGNMTMEVLMAIITKLLTAKHGMENFTVTNMTQVVELATTTTNTLTTALTAIGLIALLVGGIGIMNIMLASVAERTREIGIRKAVGGSRIDVLLQFLLESVTVTVTGGTIGIIIGYIASNVAGKFYTTRVTPMSILIGFAVSVVIGIFFGVYPAMKASRLNPVEALRYE